MKKFLFSAILVSALVFGSLGSCFAADVQYYDIPTANQKTTVKRCQCKKYFEQHLGLTKEQIKLVDANRVKQNEELKPVNNKIKANYKEIREIEKSNVSENSKEKKISNLRNKIDDLKAERAKIKAEYNTTFESYLSEDQLKTLEQMRELRKQGKSCCPCGKNRYY